MDDIGGMKVTIETSIPELSEKVKRLQQMLAEAETLIQEINDFKLKVNVEVLKGTEIESSTNGSVEINPKVVY